MKFVPLLVLFALQGQELAVSRVETAGGRALPDPLVVFAGPSEGVEERARAHSSRDREEIGKLRAPSAGEEVFVTLLFGQSPNGHDPLRQTTVSARLDEKEKKLRIRVGQDRSIPLGGNKDLRNVGFSAAAGKLAAGTYSVSITGAYQTLAGERKVASDFHFTVAEAKE